MNFQDLSGLPLRQIITHLDVDSIDNLLEATEGTEMGVELMGMARKKQYACPVCVIERFTENVEEIFRQKKQVTYERRKIQMDCFGFFFQFLVTDRGIHNYKHTVIRIDENDAPLSRLMPIVSDRVRKVRFTGCYDYDVPSDDWLKIINKMTKKERAENVNVFFSEVARMQRLLFGGSFDGITIRPTLELYTRRELERHICRGHNLDDSNDLNLREFWIWTDEWAGVKTFEIPTMWYNDEREINMQSLDELIKRITAAKYYKNKGKTLKHDFARQLVSKELQIMHEALDVFTYAWEAFQRIRFPVQFGPWREKRLLNYYNMIRLTLDAMLE